MKGTVKRAMHGRRSQAGFAYIAAVVFLVVIAGIAVALLRLTDTQQSTVNQAVLGARAGLATRAGIEWVFHGPAARCAPNGQKNDLADFRSETGFLVTVTCSYRSYFEGEQLDAKGDPQPLEVRIYQIQAIACNGAGSCPGNVTGVDYVERARTATICMRADGAACDEPVDLPQAPPVQP